MMKTLFVWFLSLLMTTSVVSTANNHPFGVKVYTLGEPVLKKSCKAVSKDEILTSPALKAASNDAHTALNNFRAKMGFGRAIAAPQVGHPLRFVALNINGVSQTLFNPEIINHSDETFTMWDDCLSFPDLMCCVRRYKWISVEFQNEQGEEVVWEHCDQALSELLQHEIDHLDGILAIDRAVKPKEEGTCDGVVSRVDWLQRRDYYDPLVDHHY